MPANRHRPPDQDADDGTVHVWRHPRAQGAEGRCIGRTDLGVDRRKAKRLAHRIRAFARRHGLPPRVVTSPLRRGADVGRVLAAWGWQHRIDPALAEVDFGHWDGRRWADIDRAAIDAWAADLLHARPGGGEPVCTLLRRVQLWRPGDSRLAVGHGGWLSAALWLARQDRPAQGQPIAAGDWPAAPAHASRTVWRGRVGLVSAGDCASPHDECGTS